MLNFSMSSACCILPRVGRECFRKLRMHHTVKVLQFAPAQIKKCGTSFISTVH